MLAEIFSFLVIKRKFELTPHLQFNVYYCAIHSQLKSQVCSVTLETNKLPSFTTKWCLFVFSLDGAVESLQHNP